MGWKTGLGMFALLGIVGCATAANSRAVHTPGADAAHRGHRDPAPSVSAPAVHHTVVAPETTRAHPSVSGKWLDFRDQRSAYLETLIEPLLACAEAKPKLRAPECNKRIETFEVPLALSAAYRITKDPRYAKAADKTIDRKLVAQHARFDRYSSAWFLALARERELATRETDLRKTAELVAARLETSLADLDEFAFAQAALFGSEQNVAWAVYHLWRWADHSADGDLAGRTRQYTSTRMLGADMDSWCPMPVDSEPENFEFIPPCLQRAMTVLAVMPEQISNKWLEDFVAAQDQLSPVDHPRLATHGALNFARAWGLWSLYAATGDGAYRDSFVDHMDAGVGQLRRAKAKGAEVDPWQAAFGVYALSYTYEP
jgi:hypothetical protein